MITLLYLCICIFVAGKYFMIYLVDIQTFERVLQNFCEMPRSKYVIS